MDYRRPSAPRQQQHAQFYPQPSPQPSSASSYHPGMQGQLATQQSAAKWAVEDDVEGFEIDYAMAALKDLDVTDNALHHSHGQFNHQSIPHQHGYHQQPHLQQAAWGLRNSGTIPGKKSHELSSSVAAFELRPFGSQGDPLSSQHSSLPPSSNRAKMVNNTQHHDPRTLMSQQVQPPSAAASRSWAASSLPGSVVERNDYREMARFILECKNGNEAAALDFLRSIFLAITNPTSDLTVENHDWDNAVRNGPPYLTPEDQAAAQAQLVMHQQNSILLQSQRLGIPPRAQPIIPITLFGDEIDQRLSTLVVLIPGRAHIVGHLIGKGGAEVGRIEREMAVTIKIESASKMGIPMVERSVCIIGSVAAATLAQQFVSHKVHEKLLSEGVQAEVLKMIVPNEIVRHLIGKSGANINRLQNESGARIQVEPESTMAPGAVGRTIVLQGAERCRTFAQYLILRQIAEDRNVHSEWAGRIPQNHLNGSNSPPTSAPHASNATGQSSAPVGTAAHTVAPAHANGALMASISQLANASPHLKQPSSDNEYTVVIAIPEHAASLILGRNGTTIAEIQNLTGAALQISASDSDLGDSQRKLIISGPPAAVNAAQQQVRQRLLALLQQ